MRSLFLTSHRPLLSLAITLLLAVSGLSAQVATAADDPLVDAIAPEQNGLTGTVLTNTLKLRRAPRYRNTDLGTLGIREQIRVIGRTARADWVQAETRLGIGWLDLRYVSFDGQTLSLPITEDTVPPFAIVADGVGVTVRAGPSEAFPSIGKFNLNNELDIIGLHTANTYVQVRTNKGIGWVKLNAVRVVGSLTGLRDTDRDVQPYVRVNVYRVNVRVAPNENAAELLTAKSGDLFLAEGRSADGAWLRIKLPTGSAWLIASAVELIGYDNLSVVN